MDNHTIEQRRHNMANIRSVSKPEETVRKYLFSQGFRYRKNDKRYAGTPDIVLPKYKTIVFINGCFWHQHPGCSKAAIPKSNTEYWLPKLQKNVSRDRHNYAALENEGWNVLVIWECMLSKKNIDDTLNKLQEDIKKQKQALMERGYNGHY